MVAIYIFNFNKLYPMPGILYPMPGILPGSTMPRLKLTGMGVSGALVLAHRTGTQNLSLIRHRRPGSARVGFIKPGEIT